MADLWLGETIVVPSENEFAYSPRRWWCSKQLINNLPCHLCGETDLNKRNSSDAAGDETFEQWAMRATDPTNWRAPLAPATCSITSWNNPQCDQHLMLSRSRDLLDHSYATEAEWKPKDKHPCSHRASNRQKENPFAIFMCRNGWEWQTRVQNLCNQSNMVGCFTLPRNDSIPAPVNFDLIDNNKADGKRSNKKCCFKIQNSNACRQHSAKPYATSGRTAAERHQTSKLSSKEKLIVKFDFKTPKSKRSVRKIN